MRNLYKCDWAKKCKCFIVHYLGDVVIMCSMRCSEALNKETIINSIVYIYKTYGLKTKSKRFKHDITHFTWYFITQP